MKRVLRWQVPIDDQPHEVGGGPVLLVELSPRVRDHPDWFGPTVEVWTHEETGPDWPESTPAAPSRLAQVVGTGHPHPDDWTPLGSVVVPPFVWHLMNVPR